MTTKFLYHHHHQTGKRQKYTVRYKDINRLYNLNNWALRKELRIMVVAEKDIQAGAAAPAAPSEDSKRGGPGKKQKQAAAAAAPAVAVAADRKKLGVPGFLRSPWLLAAAALLVGGFWLVLHPSVITDNINKPYALLAGPALAGSFLACWLVVKFFEAIEHGLRSAWAAFLAARKEDGSAQFFWIVIAVFLAVSVFASGDFFSKLEHDAVPGLGYATALFIDLVAVQCMRARLNAGRMRDRRGQLLYLLGVLICAAASAFANVYTSLSTFTDKAAGALPAWMPAVAPWFGLVFPALIVLLSMTADYTVDQTSSKLNPDQYKEVEGKRVRLLSIQRDLLRDRVGIEREIDELAAQLRGRKERRVFFLVAWLFPVQVPGARILEQVEGLYKPQLDALTEQNTLLRGQLASLAGTAQAAYAGLDRTVQDFIQAADLQRDTDNHLLNERIESLAAGLAAAPAGPDYQALAQEVIPWLSPVLDGLRQEVRGLVPAAAPAAPELNYTKLARALAPLLVVKEKETGLHDANTEATETVNEQETDGLVLDTEKLAAINLGALAASNGHHETSTNGTANNGPDASLDALLERSTVSIQDAARLIDNDVKYVRTLRSRGKLKATPRNNDLITVASIKTYLAESRRAVKA
jgi:hypothetical protein